MKKTQEKKIDTKFIDMANPSTKTTTTTKRLPPRAYCSLQFPKRVSFLKLNMYMVLSIGGVLKTVTNRVFLLNLLIKYWWSFSIKHSLSKLSDNSCSSLDTLTRLRIISTVLWYMVIFSFWNENAKFYKIGRRPACRWRNSNRVLFHPLVSIFAN